MGVAVAVEQMDEDERCSIVPPPDNLSAALSDYPPVKVPAASAHAAIAASRSTAR